MPVATCSATAAGPLPSTTQAMAGAGFVGSWGATNTAPSGLSAAVTRSAAKGSAIGAPGVSGPEVAGGGNVVLRPLVVVALCWVDVVVVGVDGLELHDARSAAAATRRAA